MPSSLAMLSSAATPVAVCVCCPQRTMTMSEARIFLRASERQVDEAVLIDQSAISKGESEFLA